ncbi:MAG TPA: hypothetical protein VF194_07270 [Ferrovibrio sp.]|uniref:hypothetical protein n=1 Tax=Ferrovibrio sp. TaxID=1917215 RepID=UPI002ED05C7A
MTFAKKSTFGPRWIAIGLVTIGALFVGWRAGGPWPAISFVVATTVFYTALGKYVDGRRRTSITASGKDISPSVLEQTAARRNMIANFGAFIEEHPLQPTDIYDQGTLPHPKDVLLDAMLLELTRTNDATEQSTLQAGAMLLARFQPGVGPTPLSQLGVDLTKMDGLDPTVLVKMIAANSTAAAWEKFKSAVDAEELSILAKTRAAIDLGKMMPAEKKLQIFGT